MKKPDGFKFYQEHLEKEHKIKLDPEKIVVVGDRLATDIAFGNINNMASVFVHPFEKYDSFTHPLSLYGKMHY